MTLTVTTPITGCLAVLHLACGTCSETRGSPDDPAHLGQTVSSPVSANTNGAWGVGVSVRVSEGGGRCVRVRVRVRVSEGEGEGEGLRSIG